MYFLLAGGMRGRFVDVDVGLAVLLVFIGATFMLSEIVEIGVGISLLLIVAVMSVSIAASLFREPQHA
jgi:tellurite resistance protein TerC